jgi:predicted Zn-dependent protease
MLTFIAGMQKDNEKLKQIITESVGSSAYSEIERDFCQLFLSSNEFDTSGNLSRINSIKKKSPPNPYIDLVYARELLRTKKFLEADSAYRKLPTVMLSSPIILVEIATVQANCGKGDEALARISKMHQHNIFNKPSLELFRDLTFKKKLFEKTIAAQKLLEQRFKDDAGLQWKGALLALNQGKLDSAITLLSVLSKKYPKEPQFEITRITAILLKGDYNTALKECSTSTAPAPVLKTLQAKALRKMDKPELARTAYEEALSLTKGEKTELLLEYAEFLIELGDNKKASSVFGDLAAEYEKKPNQNPLGLAMLFNNLAWTSLQSGIYNEKTLIDAAKKAYDLQPENLSIIDTYATILLKFLKYKECITLLKDKPSVIKEPRLASHLGQAFEKSGDINRAVRAYQDAIAIPDSSMQLPLLVSKDKLTEHIKILQTAKK